MPDSPNLNQLIADAIKGVSQAQERIFYTYAGKMMTLCRRYARDEAEAQDFLQEGFIRVFNFLHTFENSGIFDAWIRRIFVNTALKQLQKKNLINYNIPEESLTRAIDEFDVVSRLSEEEILKLVHQLPTGYKAVFNLYAIEGYSHKEIADLLSIEESTSRSQLVKARKMLQEKISELHKVAI